MWKYWINLGLILFVFFSSALSCSEEEIDCIENVKEQCGCITLYDPVCGCNGKTYGNSCEALCAGIEDYTEGECE